MKPPLFFLLVLTLSACHHYADKTDARQAVNPINQRQEPVKTTACLMQADAEKILGQAATLTESSSENKNGITTFRCTYTATATDPETNKTGNLYYMLEEFSDVSVSQKAYSDILKQNGTMPGLKELKETGDQAFFHTDNENFAMVISRKNNKIVRLKVNKLTGKTSPDELKNVSKTIVASL